MMVVASIAVLVGCAEKTPPVVVVYSSVDKEIAAPIFADFTKSTGIVVRASYKAEAAQSGSIAQTIYAERERPRCDLFWNNDILSTLLLERSGLLREYASPAAAKYPTSCRSSQNMWFGFAAQARVFIVNKNQIAEARRPDSLDDLTDPQWYERTAIAKPLYGTSATHADCLFQAWGDAKAEEFFHAVKRNARILADNRAVAHAVASGQLAFGLTDSGAAVAELTTGSPVTLVYPDQEPGGLGTLFVPNTLALVKDAPHPHEAELLLDYLLSPAVERRLAEGPAARIPLQPGVTPSDRVKTPGQVVAMNADFAAAADRWATASNSLRTDFAVQSDGDAEK
jgi:iron(III) transport system substrate-binding protein